MAGIQLDAEARSAGRRGHETLVKCFENGVLVRVTSDTVAIAPPLIVEKRDIDRMFEVLADVLGSID